MVRAILRPRLHVVCVLLFVLAGVTVGGAQVPVTTWHYDNARTGANPNETILTPVSYTHLDVYKRQRYIWGCVYLASFDHPLDLLPWQNSVPTPFVV